MYNNKKKLRCVCIFDCNQLFQIIPGLKGMAPGNKSKSIPKRKSKRIMKKVNKQSNQNLKMDWVKMEEQRANNCKKQQNRKSAQTWRNKKKAESEIKDEIKNEIKDEMK